MWIRSQGGRTLLEANFFKTTFHDQKQHNKYEIYAKTKTSEELHYVGRYKTLERANEVMDEIQDYLRKSSAGYDSCLIYQLPRD